MKKQFTSFIFLFVIILGFFNIAYNVLPAAKATPVEGVIWQDTLWTLVDSPFVVTNNITVNSGVTLIIEPGVEVRFGGEFSIIVVGKIIAQGTEERKIRFTTNDPSADSHWRSISISGAQSSFRHCIIEYGTNGTVVEVGSLDIQESTVQLNSENGLVVNGGVVNVDGNEFAFNGENAILISGGSSVMITNNIMRSNAFGLTLSGYLTGNVRVQQNEISNNTEAGIALEAEIFADTLVSENNVTLNGRGFLVQANATNISHNYISRNSIGVYYGERSNGLHQVNSNDIYENNIGIDLASSSMATINAIHNYWGDRTGPKHQWLNPHGKGNLVGGDGVNLEFIPFYNHPFAYINNPPTAILWTDVITAAVGQTVTFVGTDSQDDGSIARYYFDFNDTGNSGSTTLSLYNHTYYTTGTFLPSLIVWDDVDWWSSQAYTTINVVDFMPLQASVTINDSAIAYNGETWVTVYVSDGVAGVYNANVQLFSVGGGNFDPQSGQTDSNGYFAVKFTAPNVTETIDARIIARASTFGYADGTGHGYVRVISPLGVEVSSQAPRLESEGNTTITAHVIYDSTAVANATVTAFSDVGGNFSETLLYTDLTGTASFEFTAPQTVPAEGTNVTITVRASKEGFVEGQSQITLPVYPKTLDVQIIPDALTIYSGGKMNVTVNVGYNDNPIENANVTASSVNGTFAPTVGVTDANGNVTFVLTATDVNQESNATISVIAAKEGYLDNTDQIDITIKLRTFSISVTPSTVHSGQTETIMVHVTSKEDPAPTEAAVVVISFENGQQLTNITDSSGACTFLVKVPETSANTINMTVTVTRIGYEGKQAEIVLNAVPAEGGFPWWIIVIIAIPVIVAVVVVVLIKKKIVVVSAKEEGSE